MDTLRSIKLHSGHTLAIWDANTRARTGQYQLRYEFREPATEDHAFGAVLFEGADYGVSPMHSIDSDAALLGLLSFLSLRPGDTDDEYFAEYTPAQLAWTHEGACESLSCDVSVAEEAGGCACGYVWENLDGWACDDAGNVAEFEVLDHGEDGSQYFPGCGVAFSRDSHGNEFERCATGVGDTAREALDDALEMAAQDDAEFTKLQEAEMVRNLDNPDASAFESLDHSECGEDHDTDDWNHYVSIRYTLREEK